MSVCVCLCLSVSVCVCLCLSVSLSLWRRCADETFDRVRLIVVVASGLLRYVLPNLR
eukprot:COSAG03_NODE_549_length_6991_cov_40.997970_8_plen_57_part_00